LDDVDGVAFPKTQFVSVLRAIVVQCSAFWEPRFRVSIRHRRRWRSLLPAHNHYRLYCYSWQKTTRWHFV